MERVNHGTKKQQRARCSTTESRRGTARVRFELLNQCPRPVKTTTNRRLLYRATHNMNNQPSVDQQHKTVDKQQILVRETARTVRAAIIKTPSTGCMYFCLMDMGTTELNQMCLPFLINYGYHQQELLR
jgi:hypothetical protein